MSGARWRFWLRQVLAVTGFEIRRILAGRRWIFVSLLAWALPLLLMMAVVVWATQADETAPTSDVGLIFAGIFQSYGLRLAVFFGCVLVFTHLFRGEVLEKTLHYYLLTPVRRECIMAGKYLAVPAAVVSYILIHVPTGSRAFESHFVNGAGVSHALTYACVTFLASAGYGAVFLLMGIVFRNPIVPAALVLGWESLNIFLPPVLQRISVIHYLQSILPVPLPYGPLAVITEPTSPWISVPGLIVTTLLVLVLAAFRLKRAEISYAVD
jgi:ABC-type transport system involved in multi-copper enzyme maturation permease subunit